MLIDIQNVTVEYCRGSKGFNALDHLSVGIESGDFMAVLGKSGSGKTTLLNLIAGIQRPSSGAITIAGRDFSSMSDRDSSRFRNAMIGYVPQRNGLFSHLTVLENVLLPAQLHVRGKEPMEAAEILDALGIWDLSGAFPKELSGGEQRRASIARALINRPDVLLADEPTSLCDPVYVHDTASVPTSPTAVKSWAVRAVPSNVFDAESDVIVTALGWITKVYVSALLFPLPFHT